MATQTQITVRDMEHSKALDDHIAERVARLERISVRLTACRVVVELSDRHRHQGRQFSVNIDLSVPGKEIVVNHHHAEDVYVALRDAFDAAKRQLEEYARIQRGEVKKRTRRRT